MTDWDAQKQQFIQKIEHTQRLFQELFAKDKQCMIFDHEKIEKLRQLQIKNKEVLQKLQTKEFTERTP